MLFAAVFNQKIIISIQSDRIFDQFYIIYHNIIKHKSFLIVVAISVIPVCFIPRPEILIVIAVHWIPVVVTIAFIIIVGGTTIAAICGMNG